MLAGAAAHTARPSQIWRSYGFQPLPNSGQGHCFWLSLTQNNKQEADRLREQVASWLKGYPRHPASPDGEPILAGCLTTEWHVDAAVQAGGGQLFRDLRVFHEPAGVLIKYAPKLDAGFILFLMTAYFFWMLHP